MYLKLVMVNQMQIMMVWSMVQLGLMVCLMQLKEELMEQVQIIHLKILMVMVYMISKISTMITTA